MLKPNKLKYDPNLAEKINATGKKPGSMQTLTIDVALVHNDDWQPLDSGIVVGIKDVGKSRFTYYPIDARKKKIYEDKVDQWSAYNNGILLRSGSTFTFCTVSGEHTVITPASGDGWRAYGGQIYVRRGDASKSTFLLSDENGAENEICIAAYDDWNATKDGIIIRKEDNFSLHTLDGKVAELYSGPAQHWNACIRGIIVQNGDEKESTVSYAPANAEIYKGPVLRWYASPRKLFVQLTEKDFKVITL
ncbi:MAG: hypothetical protein V1725_04465 [archaeon]